MNNISYISEYPHFLNPRINPGLRHPSRLYTKPTVFPKRNSKPDPFPDTQLKVVRNKFGLDSQPSMLMIDAMNIFGRQLPNMGTIYISRLVFDIKAFTVIIFYQGRAHGGICSRVFDEEKFIEIAFCAVDYQLQGKGHGRLLMNYLKDNIQIMRILDIITCADNEAVNYFRKMGFNKNEILMNPKRWVGCIKDYDGITLVHCKLRDDIVYLKFHMALKKQIELLCKKTGVCFNQTFKKLETRFKPFPQAPSVVCISLPEILSKYTLNGKSNALQKQYLNGYDTRMKRLKEKIIDIFESLESDKKFADAFERPLTEDIAQGYFTKVKKPMDFLTIRKRLIRFNDYYKRPNLFALDIKLICDNCKLYNNPDSYYYKLANELMKKFTQLYNESFPDYPLDFK